MLMGTPATAQSDDPAFVQADTPAVIQCDTSANVHCDSSARYGTLAAVQCGALQSIKEPQEDQASEGHTGYTTTINSCWMEFEKGASLTRNDIEKFGKCLLFWNHLCKNRF
jgi:hypothetical protein